MSDIQAVSTVNNIPRVTSANAPATGTSSSPTILPEQVTDIGTFSAEAQYLFDTYFYLQGLDEAEQSKAVDFLSQSSDPLQIKAAAHFRKSWEELRPFREGKVTFDNSGLDKNTLPLFDPNFVIDEKSEIAVIPPGVEIFRLDGNKNFYSVQLGRFDTEINRQLNDLEKASVGILGNQNHANVFGAVRNALQYSENIMLSVDDVLHFNYVLDKAREALRFINPPQDLKTALTSILNKGIIYQNNKQSQFLDDTLKLFSNSRVGATAKENFRLGIAAQNYNSQLQATLKATNLSVLNARGVIAKLLTQNTDLLRFSLNKIDEALSFYKKDYGTFERALRKDFSLPVVEQEPKVDYSYILKIGNDYALKVIDQIKNYMSSR